MTKSPITLACFGPFKKYKPEPQPDRPEWGFTIVILWGAIGWIHSANLMPKP